MLSTIYYPFPGFTLKVTFSEQHIIAAQFAAATEYAEFSGRHSWLSAELIRQLDSYLADGRFGFNLPFQFSGSRHQLMVWQMMQQIPAGWVLSYGQVARLINSAAQAVGGACGKNPLALLIPCHRIIAANSQLGGFNSGSLDFNLEIKQWLLNHEGVHIERRLRARR